MYFIPGDSIEQLLVRGGDLGGTEAFIAVASDRGPIVCVPFRDRLVQRDGDRLRLSGSSEPSIHSGLHDRGVRAWAIREHDRRSTRESLEGRIRKPFVPRAEHEQLGSANER